MGPTTPRMVLVHGSWGGPLAWERVVPLLNERGIDAVAVELPGRGSSSKKGWRVSLADYGNAINDAAGKRPAVVVGHSAGGFAITQAACSAAAPHRALIYLAAYLPIDGERLVQLARRDSGSGMASQIRPNPLRGVLDLKIDGLEEVLFHDYQGDDLDELLERFVPEPMRPQLTKVKLTQTFRDTPKYYIRCALDRAVSPDYQDWMCARHSLSPHAVLQTGHMPARVDPGGLADALAAIHEEVRKQH